MLASKSGTEVLSTAPHCQEAVTMGKLRLEQLCPHKHQGIMDCRFYVNEPNIQINNIICDIHYNIYRIFKQKSIQNTTMYGLIKYSKHNSEKHNLMLPLSATVQYKLIFLANLQNVTNMKNANHTLTRKEKLTSSLLWVID